MIPDANVTARSTGKMILSYLPALRAKCRVHHKFLTLKQHILGTLNIQQYIHVFSYECPRGRFGINVEVVFYSRTFGRLRGFRADDSILQYIIHEKYLYLPSQQDYTEQDRVRKVRPC